MKHLIATSLALTVFLTGCSSTNNHMASDANQHRSGTAMVPGMDGQDMVGMNMNDLIHNCQNQMMQHLGNADAQYDERFIDMMISHHQGAIAMAKDAQQKAQHPEIRQMAQNIIDSQQKEIDKLKAWRTEWYNS